MQMMKPATLAAWLGLTLVAATCTGAENYPAKPVRLIIPFTPGGGADTVARLVGAKLETQWKQQVIVDNRSGAGGNLAAELTAAAAPDGYTLFQFNVANAIAVGLYPKLGYDPLKDFSPVTRMGSSPFVMVVHPGVKAGTVQELIALAKLKSGSVTFSSGGSGSSTHLAAELFKSMAGIDIVHVPYKGGAPALNDVIAGQVNMMVVVPVLALPHVKTGRLRALAMSSTQRSALAPELPTIAEAGVPGYESSTWYAIVAPSRTPAGLVARLNADFRRAMDDAQIQARLLAVGIELTGSTPDQLSKHMKSEIEKWRHVVKTSGAKAE